MLKLIIEDDEGRKTVVPFSRDEITIGRQEGNTIRLTERNVSRRHARLMRNNGHVLIEDLGSYNGIRINGDRISGQVQVADGDLIQIGDYDLALQAEEAAAAAGATVPLDSAGVTRKLPDPGATLPALPSVEDPDEGEVGKDAPEPIPKHQATAVIRLDQLDNNTRKRPVLELDGSGAPKLVVLNTELAGQEFRCTKTELRIGRVDDNDIVIDHRSLSRTHCKVMREDNGEWRIIDMQSANGLLVNGESYGQVTLRPGDVIELGHVKLKFAHANDRVALEAGSSASNLGEPGPSKAPLIALAGALLVVLVGVGGYLLTKTGEGPAPKPPQPKTTVDPSVARARQLKDAQGKLAEARQQAAALDFNNAELTAKEALVNGELISDAKEFLELLEAERGNRSALELAARHLDANQPDKARAQLDAAAGTQLLRERYDTLDRRATEAKVAKIEPPKQPDKPEKPPEKQPDRQPEKQPEKQAEKPPEKQPEQPAGNPAADALIKEAVNERRAGNLERARVQIDKCMKIAPQYASCYLAAGAVYASIASEYGKPEERAKARKHYERFVELAPADHPTVPKVKQLLLAE